MKTVLSFLLIVLSISGFAASPPKITSEAFGKTADGTVVNIYTLRNASGMEARIMDYGGIIVSLKVPDRNGKLADIVLGYDTLDSYFAGSPYYGAIIGRYASRIGGGQFDLEGVHYKLNAQGYTTLHGGWKGFDKSLWTSELIDTKTGPAVKFTYLSKDGEEGFPGNLTVTATYSLNDKNELHLDFTAKTDKPTVLNLSNHSYFNLAGQGEGDILGHELTIDADKFVVINSSRLPTGELRDVAGTPMDFRKPFTIGSRMETDYDQLTLGRGYDHCWVLNKKPGELTVAAKVVEPKSGRVMEVLTTEPGLQFYAGVNLGDDTGKGGKTYTVHSGLCLEPGHFPDSPNHPNFPSTELRPGDTFSSAIIYRFSTQ